MWYYGIDQRREERRAGPGGRGQGTVRRHFFFCIEPRRRTAFAAIDDDTHCGEKAATAARVLKLGGFIYF